MSDGNTSVNAGAWFVYEYDEQHDDLDPVGVFSAADELSALRCANTIRRRALWWPYGLTLDEALNEAFKA